MKNSVLLTCLFVADALSVIMHSRVETDEQPKGFKRENMFFGSSLNLSLGNRFFQCGCKSGTGL